MGTERKTSILVPIKPFEERMVRGGREIVQIKARDKRRMRRTFVRRSEARGVQRRDAEFINAPLGVRIANAAEASQPASILDHSIVPVLGLAVLLLAAGCMPEASNRENRSAASVTITRTEDGYLFAEDSDSVMLYRDRALHPEREFARAHYVHPLIGPRGEILTEDSPADHPHQHGLYWAWHQVYVGDQRVGDGWIQEDISWNVRDVEVLEGVASSALRAHVSWLSPQYLSADVEHEPFVDETATFRVFPRADGQRQIDVTIELRALVDSVRIGGSEDEKGYGGFSARIRLPQDIRFVGRAGAVQPQNTAVEAGEWLDMSATFGEQGPTGLAILQHPSNPGYPQPWILRNADSMQNVKWPGADPVVLPLDEPITLRYRLILHDGLVDAATLEELHAQYASVDH